MRLRREKRAVIATAGVGGLGSRLPFEIHPVATSTSVVAHELPRFAVHGTLMLVERWLLLLLAVRRCDLDFLVAHHVHTEWVFVLPGRPPLLMASLLRIAVIIFIFN